LELMVLEELEDLSLEQLYNQIKHTSLQSMTLLWT